MGKSKSEAKGLEIVLDWKDLVFVIIAGVCITLALGLVENPPETPVRHMTPYGWPLVWRLVKWYEPEAYNIPYLLADFTFWIGIVFLVFAIFDGVSRELGW